MRPRSEEAELGGKLGSYRNLPPSFFEETEVTDFFISEADDRQYPEPAPLDQYVESSYYSADPATGQFLERALDLCNPELPIYAHSKKIIDTVRDNRVTIITAETGSGKSTQVPKILYATGEYETIYLTQPRRAAAYAVRDRIRQEMNDALYPGAGDHLTCYQTAVTREGPEDAPIKVVTDGLQLVRELHDDTSDQKKVIVIDELHERNFNVDLIGALAKRAITQNPNLRVVIMSATMDAPRMAAYFADVCKQPPTIIEVPGRNFTVVRLERPESTVITETVAACRNLHVNKDPQNTVLVFQPGKSEIKDTIDEVRRLLPADIRNVATVLPFHSKLTKEEQDRVFREYPGVVIIVATNSAQTSLTLPRVKYVIDSGLERRVELDQEGIQGLVLHHISQADCDQRAGRAGRVSNGIYILTRGNEKTEYVPYAEREKFPTPEILRTDIVRNTLRCAAAGLDLAEMSLLDSPSTQSIERAKATLRAYGTLDEHNVITPLGLQMDRYPLRISSARMVVEAERYAETTRAYVAAIVAAREVGGLQLFGRGIERRWHGPNGLTQESASDHLAQLDIFIAIQGMSQRELRNYDLDAHNVVRAYEHYDKIVKLVNARHGYILPPTRDERDDIVQCVVAGLAHSVYKHAGDGQYAHLGDSDTHRILSNRSVIAGRPAAVVGDPYRIEAFKDGEKIIHHTIEYPTEVQLAVLGRIATHLTTWEAENLTMRGGKFVQVERQHLGGADLGITREVIAEPSPQLREAVIAHTLANPLSQQKDLREIKRKLEKLAHLAKDPVPQLTQDRLLELLQRAATPDISSPEQLDANLRRIVQDENISLASYVSPEREKSILEHAPDFIAAGEVVLPITYRNGKPIVQHIRDGDVAKLHDDVFLQDGREVKFRYARKIVNLHELRQALFGDPQPPLQAVIHETKH